MSIPDRIPHALHNEQLCDYIIQSNQYHDWVVTTAFYAALHFVQSKMFPLNLVHPVNGSNVTLDCFEQYYGIFGRATGRNKHDATANLVSNHLPAVSNDYRRLKDACRSARYNNYQVSQNAANAARQRLINIKAACVLPVLQNIANPPAPGSGNP